ncbi:SWIB/MDM2 domain [seawater metagenome]|uniref:SWIB/MDM2 domain n=1 Tax=seawater metagenome TaxID=1561972 RepID=A0A5E8CK95_9ZZZZ
MGKKSKQNKKQSKVVDTVEVEVVSDDDVEVEVEVDSTQNVETENESTKVVADDSSSNDEETWEDVATRITERDSEILKMQKANIRDQKLLHKLHNKAVRDARKNRRNKNSSNRKLVKSGFNKPTAVPEPIAKLFDIEEGTLLARTVVTKMIYQYIRDNELQNPENKRQIRPDKKIRNLFSLTKSDTLSFENFQTHMKKLYPPSKKDLAAMAETQNASNTSNA